MRMRKPREGVHGRGGNNCFQSCFTGRTDRSKRAPVGITSSKQQADKVQENSFLATLKAIDLTGWMDSGLEYKPRWQDKTKKELRLEFDE